ncbi:sensor histidine kinase [Kibdelosporangium philippinense]|uniref:Oxygen sensor histidine kinase NreB n=1 Tax=Kibdelosporangium philippinense TaxID=211113 RepID=A0ABS8ZJF2_9PSEU|nr:sensor histidine kinase [Kibdelosporangium philippinense]MCE7007919.1 sensor histidine kinase [Kibdelosporangium philippinense]
MDEWRRGFVGWHVLFGVLAAITAVVVFVEGGLAVAHILLAALTIWYLVFGATAVRKHGNGVIYLTGAIPLTIAMFVLTPLGSIMLFALYPHIWVLLPTCAAVYATVTVISATTVVVAGASVLVAVSLGVVTLLIGLALGLWITRIIDQSKERAALVVGERQRLAREIHDTLAQGFAAMLLQLEAIEAEMGPNQHLTKAKQVARDNLAEARALVDALAPPDLRASSLPDALERIAEARNVAFKLQGKPRALPPTHEVMVLRAVQEALNNTAKHANATATEVQLTYASKVTLTVSDNGIGFDAEGRHTGFGLTAMRARAKETGAELTIESSPGNGTTLRLEVAHARADR